MPFERVRAEVTSETSALIVVMFALVMPAIMRDTMSNQKSAATNQIEYRDYYASGDAASNLKLLAGALGAGGGYMLGIGLYELGSLSLANMDLHREAQPFVDQLARHSSASVHLGVFNGQSVVVIEREDFEEPRKSLASRVEIAPIHCTGVGKAVGAYLPKDLVARIAAGGLRPYTSHTITSLAALERALAKVRKRGYALDNEELQLFVRCVAAPIRNAAGRVFAAISVSGPPERMTVERQLQLASVVIDTAGAISRHLGFDGTVAG